MAELNGEAHHQKHCSDQREVAAGASKFVDGVGGGGGESDSSCVQGSGLEFDGVDRRLCSFLK